MYLKMVLIFKIYHVVIKENSQIKHVLRVFNIYEQSIFTELNHVFGINHA